MQKKDADFEEMVKRNASLEEAVKQLRNKLEAEDAHLTQVGTISPDSSDLLLAAACSVQMLSWQSICVQRPGLFLVIYFPLMDPLCSLFGCSHEHCRSCYSFW